MGAVHGRLDRARAAELSEWKELIKPMLKMKLEATEATKGFVEKEIAKYKKMLEGRQTARFRFYRDRLSKYYARHNPAKAKNVPGIVQFYVQNGGDVSKQRQQPGAARP